jgi:hypothetical protein
MRLLTHNTLRNNSKDANGKGFPLRITAVEVNVLDNPETGAIGKREINFVKGVLPTLEWSALVQVSFEFVCVRRKDASCQRCFERFCSCSLFL